MRCMNPNPKSIIHRDGLRGDLACPGKRPSSALCHPDPLARGPLQFAFRDFIGDVAANVDFVICDAPPDCANLLSWNCLMASDYVVSPVSMETYSAQSVAGVIRKIEEAHSNGNSNLQSLGYVVNLRNKRASLHIANEKKFRMIYGPQVFKTVIFDWIATPEAQHKKTHIFQLRTGLRSCRGLCKIRSRAS